MWKKNWPLIVVFVIVQFALAVVSYWTNDWVSVAWSIFGSAVSTFIGFFIIQKVITETEGQ